MSTGRIKAPRILIVSDGEAGTTVSQLLEGSSYELQRVCDRTACLAALTPLPGLVVLDATLTSDDAFALCMELNGSQEYAGVPICMLTPDDETQIEQAFVAGADEVITLPVRRSELRQRVGRLLKEVQLRSRLDECEQLAYQLFDQKNVMRLLVDAESGAILDANSAACAFYGYRPDVFRRKKLSDLDAYPARQMMARALRATSKQETFVVFTHRLASGETREIEMYSSPVDLQGRNALQIVLHDITQRKQMETRLRESEERFQKVLEYSSEAVFTVAPDTTITFLSQGFRSLAGFSPSEWIGRSFIPLIYYDDLPLALSMFDRVMRGEIPPPFELRFNRSDGDVNYGEVIVHPQIEDREVVGMWGAVRDITKRREAEQAEREQRVLAEALRDTAAALNGTLDRDELLGRILVQVARVVPSDTANVMLIENGVARVVRGRGYAERGLEETMNAQRFRIEDVPNMKYMVETGRPFCVPDVDQYEGWVPIAGVEWVRSHVAAPIRVNNEVIGFLNLDSATVNAFSDIDADRLLAFADQAGTAICNAELYDALRRQAEMLEQRVVERTDQLDLERAQLRTILDSLSEGVIYDEGMRVRYINRALTELTGYQFYEWTGYLDLLRSADTSPDEMRQTIASIYDAINHGRYWTGEMRLRRKDGTEFDASVTCSQVRGLDGETVGAVTVIRDISQEKALQAQKQRFVAYASHELRTPITNLKTRLYLMRHMPERLDDHIKTLEEVTDRLKRLVEDMLDTSRFERGVISLQREMIALQTVVLNVIRIQGAEAEQKNVRITPELPQEPVEVYADPERMVQVITNLLINAINYTPAGGDVFVRLRQARNTQGKLCACISVQDTGVGISSEHLPHIFQPFFRVDRRTEGTGLGLSISQQIVQLHGGEITVESKLGKGSTFHVWLPLAPAESPDPAMADGCENVLQRT